MPVCGVRAPALYGAPAEQWSLDAFLTRTLLQHNANNTMGKSGRLTTRPKNRPPWEVEEDDHKLKNMKNSPIQETNNSQFYNT